MNAAVLHPGQEEAGSPRCIHTRPVENSHQGEGVEMGLKQKNSFLIVLSVGKNRNSS